MNNASRYFGSNRTFMELKSNANTTTPVATASSNRTFMELKYDVALFLQLCFERSNRTFMELKFRHGAHSHV